MRPFFRQHAGLFRELRSQGWSWAGLALALNKARLTYRTGKPWTAASLMQAFSRAQVPLQRQELIRSGEPTEFDKTQPNMINVAVPELEQASIAQPVVVQPGPGIEAASLPPQPPAVPMTAAQSFAAAQDTSEPEFKFIRFIDWDERPSTTSSATAPAPTQPGSAMPETPPAHSQHYIEVMEQLTGKKPSF